MGWMYWTGTATNQRFFSMGDGSGKYMYVTPKDSTTNKLRFVICNGTTTQYLDGAAAIPASTWTHVAVVLSGTSGKLFVAGTPVGTGTISIDPDQLLPPNVNSTPTCNYLGKGPAGNFFQGKVDDFRVYEKALSDTEVNTIATAAVRVVPQMSSLIFGCDTDSFPASGPTGAWTAFCPVGVVLTAMASPTVDILNTKKWDLNLYADGDGYDQGTTRHRSRAAARASSSRSNRFATRRRRRGFRLSTSSTTVWCWVFTTTPVRYVSIATAHSTAPA